MTKGVDFLTYKYPEEQEEIMKTLDELIKALESLDIDKVESFHFYGPKFTRIEEGKRLDGQQCRELERRLLSSIDKVAYKNKNLQIDVLDKTAIITVDYNVEIQAGGESKSMNGILTLVLVKVGDEWKITYERG